MVVKLFVGGLNSSVDVAELEAAFATFGQVSNCAVVKDFAFVYMADEAGAQAAMRGLNDAQIGGNKIYVSLARDTRDPSHGDGGGTASGGRGGGGRGFRGRGGGSGEGAGFDDFRSGGKEGSGRGGRGGGLEDFSGSEFQAGGTRVRGRGGRGFNDFGNRGGESGRGFGGGRGGRAHLGFEDYAVGNGDDFQSSGGDFRGGGRGSRGRGSFDEFGSGESSERSGRFAGRGRGGDSTEGELDGGRGGRFGSGRGRGRGGFDSSGNAEFYDSGEFAVNDHRGGSARGLGGRGRSGPVANFGPDESYGGGPGRNLDRDIVFSGDDEGYSELYGFEDGFGSGGAPRGRGRASFEDSHPPSHRRQPQLPDAAGSGWEDDFGGEDDEDVDVAVDADWRRMQLPFPPADLDYRTMTSGRGLPSTSSVPAPTAAIEPPRSYYSVDHNGYCRDPTVRPPPEYYTQRHHAYDKMVGSGMRI